MDQPPIMINQGSEEQNFVCKEEEPFQHSNNSEAFDGIILLINRDIFEFFKTHSGNSEDAYDDIIVPRAVDKISSSTPNNEIRGMQRKNHSKSNFVDGRNGIFIQNNDNSSSKIPFVEDDIENHINKESYDGCSRQNRNSDDVTSGSSEDFSDDSEDGESKQQGEIVEESESLLRKKALNTLAMALNNKTLLKSVTKSLAKKKLSKSKQPCPSKDKNSSESRDSANMSKDSNQTRNTYEDREKESPNQRIIQKDHEKESLNQRVVEKKTTIAYKSPKRDRSPTRSNEKSYAKVSKSDNESPQYSYEKVHTNSPNNDRSPKYGWKKSADNWGDMHLDMRSKLISSERRPWKNNYQSNYYKESKFQRLNNYKKNYSKAQNYSHW